MRTRATAAFALAALCLFARTARADDPLLDRTGGLTASSSDASAGLANPDAAKVLSYVRSVSALNVVATYQADGADVSTYEGKRGLLHPGPIKSATVKGDAEIKLSAGFTRRGGEPRPTLDQIKLEADGLRFGPWNLLALQKAEINGDGSVTIKLNKWIPEIKVKKVERKSNGDVELKTNWWLPGVTIKANGDVQMKKLGLTRTVGRIDPQLFAVWPPTLEEFLGIAAALEKKSARPEPAEGGSNLLEKLAGRLSWDVRGKFDGAPVPGGGRATGDLALHGDARLDRGTLRTIGDRNTVGLNVTVRDAKVGDARTGARVDEAAVELSGKYRIVAPLAKDPSRKLVVEFDGEASFAGEGSDARLVLPDGAKVRVASADASGTVAVHAGVNGSSRTVRLDDASYLANVRGPFAVERLGPITALEADGQLSSRGTIDVGPDGLARLRGDLRGDVETQSEGFVNFLNGGAEVSGKVAKGSKAGLDLDEVLATALVPAAVGRGGEPALRSVEATGGATGSGALVDATLRKDGVTVRAPATSFDASVDGSVRRDSSGTTAGARVTAGARLEKDAAVTYAKDGTTVATKLTKGSRLGVEAEVDVDRPAAGVATVTANALNARTGPSTSAAVVRVLPRGEKLKVLGEKNGWTEVESAAGERFFVSSAYVSTGEGSTRLAGRVDGELGSEGLDLDRGGLSADLNDRVRVGVHAPFAATVGPDGKPVLDPRRTSLTTPVRVELRKGTRIGYRAFGKDNELVLDTEGSFIELTGAVELGPDGKPRIKELRDVSVRLQVGEANATVLGQAFPGLQIGKAVELRGQVTFGRNGIDIRGSAGLANANGGAPIFHVSF